MAGYDLTFSVAKSVSVLWALSDASTQARIAEIHHAAIADVIGLLEREVASTRIGYASRAQVPVIGIEATAFDHYDSRANDPQLHTHVVVSNKVKTLQDGVWRGLDSRSLHAATVGLSEYYNAVLADRLTSELGVAWERRLRGDERSAQWEIAGVGESLIAEFSSRTRMIEEFKDRLVAEYVAAHGRAPSRAAVIKMRAQATLDTRPEKHIRSLADLTASWRERARRFVGEDPAAWAAGITRGPAGASLTFDRVPAEIFAEVGARVVTAVAQKRSTWRHWNLWAEASRQTGGWRFATTTDREQAVAAIVAAAEEQSVQVTPPEASVTPARLRRADGTSMFRPLHGKVLTSQMILAAEQRLIDRGNDLSAPYLARQVVAAITAREHNGQVLSVEQADALEQIATSGRQVDLLLGPAGAGKTTAMTALRHVWVTQYGPGSVVGLAPSAAAAQVLAGDLQIGCDNTAKWLHEHDHGRADFTAGQLVIIDEATLASTLTLDRITGLAAQAGAKVLLVGDHAQLQSVDAGGAFSMLRHERGGRVPQLTEVHRFLHEWEKRASLDLRDGDTDVVETYIDHDRVRAGTSEEMVDAAYAAWRADTRAELRTLLVTDSADHVRDLNARARAERILDGDTLADREATLANDARASTGDLVITRRNNRTLRTACGGWVRNGDRWRVTDVHRDGGMEVRREGWHTGASVVLPADYVTQHVDLGYAVTAHRAQGMTVDTCHVVVATGTSRENLYVAMTRGRHANTAYVALDNADDLHTHPITDQITAHTVLTNVLAHTGVEASAHETISTERERYASIAQLAAEYETIATLAHHDRWADAVTRTLIDRAGFNPDQAAAVVNDDAFGPLCVELRRIDAIRGDAEALLERVVAGRGFEDAENVAAILTWRLWNTAGRPATGHEPHLIAGLVPEAHGPIDDETRTALDQRAALIVQRANDLVAAAIRDRQPWVADLGPRPGTEAERRAWLAQAAVVAAYRDRYQIGPRTVLGGDPVTVAQTRDRQRAQTAIRWAQQIAGPGWAAGVEQFDVDLTPR
ncbi:conjugal transfer protein [Xylanimonas protaetiae]|uniref:Conjugal transfer protein n=1 Tax=Xylanimonas protaetiae TaxID=2509457 RepID=A0A4P6F0Y8_9MICO|nr:conjugal transfer protein [Xylanimonas protaetiae]